MPTATEDSTSLHLCRWKEGFGSLTVWNASPKPLVCFEISITSIPLIDIAGEYSQDDWLDLVKPNILTRMAEYEEDQIEFSILSLAKDPLVDLVGKLAANVKCLEIVQQRLKTHEEGGSKRELVASLLENTILVPDESYGLTRVDIDEAVVTAKQMEEYEDCTIDGLMQNLQKLNTTQHDLRATIKEEQQSRQADDDYAFGRRYDYGPAVSLWIRFLARKRMLESLE